MYMAKSPKGYRANKPRLSRISILFIFFLVGKTRLIFKYFQVVIKIKEK